MSPVAVIAYVAHDKGFLGRLEGSGASIYTMSREGGLKTFSGAPAKSVKDIRATHVVWIGVPSRWVKKLGPLRFKCHYVGGAPGRWHREKDSYRSMAEIKSAQKSVEGAKKKIAKAHDAARQQAVERAKIAALHAAPDWYVPQELR